MTISATGEVTRTVEAGFCLPWAGWDDTETAVDSEVGEGRAVLAWNGYVSGILAAVLHVFSAIIVVFNSARLVRQGEDIEMAEHEVMEHRPQPRQVEAGAPADTRGPAVAPA